MTKRLPVKPGDRKATQNIFFFFGGGGLKLRPHLLVWGRGYKNGHVVLELVATSIIQTVMDIHVKLELNT